LIILQHRINATALLLNLLLLTATGGGISRYTQTYRAGFAHHRQCIEHWRFWLLISFRLSIIVLDANDNCKRYACRHTHLGKLTGPRTHLLPERHFLPLVW